MRVGSSPSKVSRGCITLHHKTTTILKFLAFQFSRVGGGKTYITKLGNFSSPIASKSS